MVDTPTKLSLCKLFALYPKRHMNVLCTVTWGKVRHFWLNTLREKCLYLEFFWSIFSRICTEKGQIPVSLLFTPNARNIDQKNSDYEHFSCSDNYNLKTMNWIMLKLFMVIPWSLLFNIQKVFKQNLDCQRDNTIMQCSVSLSPVIGAK